MPNIWNSGFFANIFTKANWKICVNEDEIVINDVRYNWISLKNLKRKPGYIWAKILFDTPDGQIELRGLPKNLAKDLEIVITELGGFLSARNFFDKLLNRDIYFRRHDIKKIINLIAETSYFTNESQLRGHLISKINNVQNLDLEYGTSLKVLNKTLHNQLLTLLPVHRLINNDFSQIDNWNQKFIASEKIKYSSFFEKVEATPLTDEQSEAAIVMEDRNLVIAAAGSGKTSALIAKIGYLVKKGYVSPEEILVLSFNNKVKNEISTRVNLRLGLEEEGFASPTIDTFHSFGYKVLKNSKQDKRLAAWVTTETALGSVLSDILYDAIEKDPNLAELTAQFISLYQGEPEIEIETLFNHTNAKTILELTKHKFNSVSNNFIKLHKTLSKDIVRSYQEMRLANWLTLYGIPFKYEASFSESLSWIGGYRPDFYYPTIECWHEHFGLNKFGKAPENWALKGKKTYEEITEEKRKFLTDLGVNWFETTSANFEDNNWDVKLEEHLLRHGANPKFIGWEKYNKLTDTPEEKNLFIKLLGAAIKHFKSNQLTIREIKQKVKILNDKSRYEKFISIFEIVYLEYQKRLQERDEIDYEDMLLDAARILEAGNYLHEFKIILIDEFQDMSNARSKMIKAMLKQSEDIRLFAVGDDWQSIYKFAGADIRVMTNFPDNFGFTKYVELTNTFRCNQGIVDLATEFILKNPDQIEKDVVSKSKSRNNAVRIIFHSGKPDSAIFTQLNLLHQWAVRKNSIIDVCLLGRYNFLEPENFTALAEKFKDRINLSFSSIHGVKGLGFDAVIVLGMTDKQGSDFPSSKQDDPVLSLFMPRSESLTFAEERRLFYVALTRAKKIVFLITPKHEGSIFVDELLRTKYQETISSVEVSDNIEYEIPQPLDAVSQKICPKCRIGRLLPRVSKYGPWMVCENKAKGFCDFKKGAH
jgi:DNA helicase-4